MNRTYPHCDSEILHAPKECYFCDKYAADLQAGRVANKVAFSGHAPKEGEQPCPATKRRPFDTANKWSGNRAQPKGKD